MSTDAKSEPMTAGFAVFNNHVNNAGAKADTEFIRLFGQEAFDEKLAPLHRDGIMLVLSSEDPQLMCWVAMVTILVNELATVAGE